jgi:hypothetical protein
VVTDRLYDRQDLDRIGAVLNLRKVWGSHTEKALELILTQCPDPAFRSGNVKPRFKPWQITPWIFRQGAGPLGGTFGIWPEAAYIEKGERTDERV